MEPKKSDQKSSRPLEEKQLVRKIREESDRKSFETIFHSYYKRLHGFAYSYMGEKETSEDIIQTVFLRIWIQRDNWDPPGTVKQYLFAAVRNEALNKLKHMKKKVETQEEVTHMFRELKSSSHMEKELEIEKFRQDIERAIDELPPRCRQIFLLNRRSGLTYSEIADYLDISINTVTTQMGRALKSLRTHLADYLHFFTVIGLIKLILH